MNKYNLTYCTILFTFLAGCSGLKVADIGVDEYRSTSAERIQSEIEKAEIPVAVPLGEEWVYNAGGAFGRVEPILIGDHVFVGTRKGEIHGIALRSGKRVGADGFGDAIDGTPAIVGTDIVIPVSWGSKKGVVSHNLRSGHKSWSLRVPPVRTDILRIDEDVVFVDHSSTVRSVRSEDGSENWVREFDISIPFLASPVELSDDVIAVVDARGHVTAMNKDTGNPVWEYSLGFPVHSDPVTDGSRMYISTTRGRLFALNIRTGSVEWQNVVGREDVRLLSASLFEDSIVVGASSGLVAVYQRDTGLEVWATTTNEAVAARPLVTRDYIFVSSMDRIVRALDRRTGENQWQAELKGRSKSEMAATENSLVILSEPRLIYYFVSESVEVARAE
ncbi:MAG: PQQ-binding-like beta-propeller repeat protein [Rhodothermales bacterium]|nr:PQQ-binding-like beta-propeller repeat protein [Rhodothermales bacterium]